MTSPDSDLCVCFHVPLRKVVTFVRLHHPRFPSQISECYGAGTGCGWCIPFLEKVFEQMEQGVESPGIELSEEEYLARRREYHARIHASKLRAKMPDDAAG